MTNLPLRCITANSVCHSVKGAFSRRAILTAKHTMYH